MKFAIVSDIKGFARLTMICVDRNTRLFEKAGAYEWDTADKSGCPPYLIRLLDPSLVIRVTLDKFTPHSICIHGTEYPQDTAKWHSTIVKVCKAISSHFGEIEMEIVEMGEVNPLHPAATDDSPCN